MTLPLEGIRIVDFSTLLPGPVATMMLADMGAEVIRVESFTRPDLLRHLSPRAGKVSAAHAYLNRNKRSVAVDLKHPQARAWVLRLIETADVLVEQFRPGVMDRLGLGYSAVAERNPRLVYCSITGYGQTGPWAHRAGHDINYLALSGVASNGGHRDTGPTLNGIQIADVAGGAHHAVIGIQAALLRAMKTGQGDHVDISMTDAALTLNHLAWAGYLAGGPVPAPEGDVLNGGGIYDYYRTADDRFMAVGSLEPQFAQALCQTLGDPDKAGLLLSQRPDDRKAAKDWLRERFASHNQAHWVRVFANVDACVEPVLDFVEVQAHPQIQSRDLFVEVSTETGTVQQPAPPIRFARSGVRREHDPGAILGHHTRDVLQELGASDEEIGLLLKNRAFHQP